jgi:hypothetical protein
MTSIQKFIEKAFAGGWRPEDREFSLIGFYERYFDYRLRSRATGRPYAIRSMTYEAVVLDPKVWQAVAKVEEWYDGPYGPEWLHHMRKMIDAVTEGKTLEEYVQFVLDKAQSTKG